MNYIPCKIEVIIIQVASYFPVISTTDPRQSGKSILLRHLYLEYKQIEYEDLNVREFAEHDPVASQPT